MDFQDKKFEFIADFIQLKDQQIILKLENLLRSEIEKAVESGLNPLISKVTQGFSEEEETYAINIFTNYVTQSIYHIQNTTKEQAEKSIHPIIRNYYTKAVGINFSCIGDANKEGFDTVRNLAIDFYKIQVGRRIKQISKEQRDFNTKVIEELRKNDSLLWSKVKNRLKYQYGYTINEEYDFCNKDTELPINWYEIPQLEVNPFVELSSKIKTYINGTLDIDIEDFTIDVSGNKVFKEKIELLSGLGVTIDYKEILPYLMNNLSESSSNDEMMIRIKKIIDTKFPNHANLHDRLNKSEHFRNLFFSFFSQFADTSVSNKVNLKFETEFYNNPRLGEYWITNKWIRNIKLNIRQGKYNELFLNRQIKLLNDLSVESIKTSDRIRKASLINELLNNIGIEVYFESIVYAIDNPLNRDLICIPDNLISNMKKRRSKLKYIGLTIEELEFIYVDNLAITDIFVGPIGYICNSLFQANSRYEKTGIVRFDQYGTINRLSRKLGLR